MVIDTSALLAMLFREPLAMPVADAMAAYGPDYVMSTVNLTEALIKVRDKRRDAADVLEAQLYAVGIRFIAPDVRQADIAAAARLRYPLNLGDCFAYALAVVEGRPLLTVDADFRGLDCEVVLPGPARAS